MRMVNGRYWRGLPEPARSAFFAATEGCALLMKEYFVGVAGEAQVKKLAPDLDATFFVSGIPRAELAEKIDLVYKDPVNLIIPVTEVYILACKQFNGLFENDQAFSAALSERRKFYQMYEQLRK